MWFPLTILSAFAWGAINVGNSTLVAKFQKSPSLLLWSQTFVSMLFLGVIAFFYDIQTPWAYAIFPMAALAYFGDLLFFWILDRLDVSVVNAAWAILAVYMSIVGFVFFGEVWTLQQFAGAALVLVGVFTLSFFSRQISFTRTILLLSFLAITYVPAYGMRKAALYAGVPVMPVLFWTVLGRDSIAFVAPLLIPSQRRNIIKTLPTCGPMFFVLIGAVISCFYVAEFALTFAYQSGPVSLISVVGNVQPFFVIFLAWVVARFLPSFAAKEVFTQRSMTVKIGSFSIVFIGLALLGVST